MGGKTLTVEDWCGSSHLGQVENHVPGTNTNVHDTHTHFSILIYFVLLAEEARWRFVQHTVSQVDGGKQQTETALAAGTQPALRWCADNLYMWLGFSLTDRLICGCKQLCTCWLSFWRELVCVCVCVRVCVFHTEVHVDSTRPLRVGHVLVNSIEYLFLHLCDGVTVQHLYWDFWTVFIVWVHTVEDLGERKKIT